jgi:DNA-binding response OmpR family regulator
MKILTAEDDEMMLRTMEFKQKREGFDVNCMPMVKKQSIK